MPTLSIPLLKRLAFGAIAALVGYALAQQDLTVPDQIKAVLIAVLGWLGAQNPVSKSLVT